MDIIKTILLVIVVIAAAAVGLIKGDFFSADQKRLKLKNMTKQLPSLLTVIPKRPNILRMR